MFNTRMDYRSFTSDDFISCSDDNSLTPKEQGDTIDAFIRQYLIERDVQAEQINALVHNVIGVLNDVKYYLLNYNPNNEKHPLRGFEMRCSHEMVALVLQFNAFMHDVEIEVDFICGCDNVVVSVDRMLHDDAECEADDFEVHCASPRGVFSAMLSPDMQMVPFKMSTLYYVFGEYADKALKNLNQENRYTHIWDLFKKKFALFKFNSMVPGYREHFIADGRIDYDSVIKDEITDEEDNEHYNFDDLKLMNIECNATCENLLFFRTMRNTMIPISELESIISEVMIDSYAMSAYAVQSFLEDRCGDKSAVSEVVAKKIDKLIAAYYNFSFGVIDSVSRMDVDSMNPMLIYKINENLATEVFKNDRLLFGKSSEEDAQNALDEFKEISSSEEDLEKRFYRYLQVDHIYNDVGERLRADVDNFETLYCAPKFMKIFGREDLNLISWSNMLRAIGGTVESEGASLQETEMQIAANNLSDSLRSELHIQSTYENMERIFKDYVHPINTEVHDIISTMNAFGNIDLPFEMEDIDDEG